MSSVDELTKLLMEGTPLTAMLAPSFPIAYKYPQIVGKLKTLGFEYVAEVAAGAINTNAGVLEALKEDPSSRFLTSPCPSFVRMIRTKHPHLKKYLAFKADSPMVATAKIVKQKYPENRPVFIGPCITKKLEASEDYPELDILVLTYKELDSVFNQFKVPEEGYSQFEFDLCEPHTRLYPISGGLAQSAAVKELLSEDQVIIASGWQNCAKAIEKFEKDENIRLVDILFCDDGCVNGPGIESDLSLEERRQRVIDFWKLEHNKEEVPKLEDTQL